MDTRPRLDIERVRELLAEQHEYEGLDYKETLNLTRQRDLVELAKDLGAMSAEGGHILVGATDSGELAAGIPDADAPQWDEARLRGRIRRYLPDVDLRTAVHLIDGVMVAVVWVSPHPLGFAIFAADGQYDDPPRGQQTVFRQGDVYVRRGSASVRADPRDMERLRLRFIEQERARVRREWASDVTSVSGPTASPPPRSPAWDLPIQDFISLVEELLARGTNVPLRLLLARTKSVAADLIAADDARQLNDILDRIACVAAYGLTLNLDWLVRESLAAFWSAYEAGHDRFAQTGTRGLAAQKVWLDIARRVVALGAYAVRAERWQYARDLALRPGEPNQPATLHRTWIRYALTHAARADLLTRTENGRQVPMSIISLAVEDANRLEPLRPDQPSGSDAILESACQFDALAGLAYMATGARWGNVYPSFAAFHEYRTEPIVVRLIEDGEVRATVAPLTDDGLADSLRWLDAAAREQFFGIWDHWYDQRIQRFLQEHPAAPNA
ncbi:MAG TPA: ATP-binding protein [candidate division Zixibacteria bacterium]|nr:ATP-binding protein [candidate division Zixibacteria bacterium]